MKFSILSYNILLNKAFSRLPPLLKKYQPDILCLQEINTQEENLKQLEKLGYKLADYANCFIEYGGILGVATYYNKKVFEFLDSKPIPLMRSFFEILEQFGQLFRFKGIKRTILKTNLHHKLAKKNITVYNIHLSPFGLNQLRIKQLNLIDFNDFDQKGSVIITGDFNFPIERKKLEQIMNKYHLEEATNKLYYTLKYPSNPHFYNYKFIHRLFTKLIRKVLSDKVKLDYIFYRGLKNIVTKRIEVYFSDHFPILSEFQLPV